MPDPQSTGLAAASLSAVRTLADLPAGARGIVQGILGDTNLKRRLAALGFVRGTEITVERAAPLGDPRIYSFLNYQLTLRNEEAHLISVTADG